MDTAYSCRIFSDEMDEVFVVEGTDREAVLQELRCVTRGKARSVCTLSPKASPPQKAQRRSNDRETDNMPRRTQSVGGETWMWVAQSPWQQRSLFCRGLRPALSTLTVDVVFFFVSSRAHQDSDRALLASRTARKKMKPESLLESDPINVYLTRKPQMPFRVLDEVSNGNYGLVISGYSLVGSTELQPYFLIPRHSIPRSNPTQGTFIPSLFYESACSPSLGYPKDNTPQAALGRRVRKRSQRKFCPYSLFEFFCANMACYTGERGKGVEQDPSKGTWLMAADHFDAESP